MPLIVTPGHFAKQAELYHQLAQMTSAGVSLLQALDSLQKRRGYRGLRQVSQLIGQGFNLTDALRRVGDLPEFDTSLIDAGERSGRLDACFRLLSDYYAERARTTRQIIMDLAYPVALLHFAIFLFPFPEFFMSGNVAVYLTKTVGVLVPLYAVVLAMLYAAQSKHGETWRGLIEMVLRPVPVAGAARQYLALSRLAAALEALLAAGVNIVEAWDLAAAACGSPGIRREVKSWRPHLQAGETPADRVNRSSWFPEMFANLYQTGEEAGATEETLQKLRNYYHEEGTRKMRAVSKWVPIMIYLGIMFFIASRIISFYMGQIQQLQKVMEP